jgi:hypothetical protein
MISLKSTAVSFSADAGEEQLLARRCSAFPTSKNMSIFEEESELHAIVLARQPEFACGLPGS